MCYNILIKVYYTEGLSMEDKKTSLSVSTEVLEKMAEIAAKEVEGVAGLSKKTMDIKA